MTAARKRGIRVGLYYSFYEWFNPAYTGRPEHAGYQGFQALEDRDLDGDEGEYVDDFMVPQIKELIDRYHPDSLCFDGEWEHGYPYWRARQIVAYYYNQAAARGQEVVVNDRYGQKKEGVSDTRGVYGDFYHVEYHANIDRAKPWAMWRGFGNSYGYNQNEHPDNILSVRDTLRMVVDVVAENGNVEFNLGPKADGTLAAFERERLAAMGAWLKAHGDAIYGTTKSPVGTLPNGRLTHKAAERTLYFHVYDWPDDGLLELPGIANRVTRAWVLSDPTQEVTASTPEGTELPVLRASFTTRFPRIIIHEEDTSTVVLLPTASEVAWRARTSLTVAATAVWPPVFALREGSVFEAFRIRAPLRLGERARGRNAVETDLPTHAA